MTKGRVIAIVVGLAVVVVTFVVVLPKIANYGDVWGVVKDLTWPQIGALAAATVVNLVTFAPAWMVALPGLGFWRAFAVTQASTASTYIAPGGAAVGFALSFAVLRAWGFASSAIALAGTLTSVWNQLALFAFPVIAFGLLGLEQETDPVVQGVALLGLVVFVVGAAAFAGVLATPHVARLVGRYVTRFVNWALARIHRGPVKWDEESFVRFRNEAIGLLRRRWHLLTLATLAGQLSVFVLFLVSLRVMHVTSTQVDGIEAFASWSLARLLGSLPITPGGIGVVEVGVTTALVSFGGANAEVVAAVLLYRFLTIVPTLVIGLAAAATFRPPKGKSDAKSGVVREPSG
jgi:putative heme transporter